jgi:hypothetical protein
MPTGADVVVRGHIAYPDEASCRRDAEQISRRLREAKVIQRRDSSWHWECRNDEGHLVVESASFPDAIECGHDLASARLETRGATAPANVYVTRVNSADLVLED